MINYLKKKIHQQQFNPGFLGVFINPFYMVRKSLYENIKEIAPTIHGSVIDIGCGQAPYKNLFTSMSSYTSVEFDTPKNRKNKSADIFYDGNHIPVPDNTFDAAILTQVLEHTFNPDILLAEISRVLKKDGLLLLTTPFVWDEHEQPHDYARYSSFGLSFLIKKHGFVVIKQKKTLSDSRAIFQLINCYIHKQITFKKYLFKLLCYVCLTAPFTILGIFSSYLLPKNNDLFIDNVLLAKRHD